MSKNINSVVVMGVKEVEAPPNNWCFSGHNAPLTFKRGGADSDPEPTKFFIIKSGGMQGTYCEPCLIVARYIANVSKKQLGDK